MESLAITKLHKGLLRAQSKSEGEAVAGKERKARKMSCQHDGGESREIELQICFAAVALFSEEEAAAGKDRKATKMSCQRDGGESKEIDLFLLSNMVLVTGESRESK
ncbi:hypothetical protein SLEP1_g31654 [Rubroshorea leprosula]|uniref:Uncharacterized protein n=1 Tax=Rubroshorea leprosula TaxID=152421 RepID=A0AAV5KBA0_9ROSI|nr:hypothetical protein SLEP1_g31654 [Rubroshorea leprosula]